MSEEGSPVTEWYKGRSIFITGGSGFMGKVMVEKLLYSCPGIKNIYLLLRNKRGKSSQQRLDAMYQLPMFERLRKSQPDAFAKIVLVNGDVNTEGLGLKTEDFDLLINNVSVVFHMAATLKLEASLKDAIEQNTAGTARVIDVCKQIKKLDCFVYFSTAFCSADVEVFEERVYEKKDDPRDVMSITKWLNSEALETATKAIIAPHPNTYTYSKRLAETLVADEKDNMPVCIVRPSIGEQASEIFSKMSEEGSPVTEWYKGRSIFITGGSGFMGKVMVEKLLYSCPGIKNIYLLLRNKRGKSSQQRLDAMYQLPKGDKPIETNCLLDAEGKLLEQLILIRLKKEITQHGGLPEHQFGLVEEKQTVGALEYMLNLAREAGESFSWSHQRLCVIITQVIRDVFNKASRQEILLNLRRHVNESLFSLLRSYLSEREIIMVRSGPKLVGLFDPPPQPARVEGRG
nr:putative fatty acyl-CoA reductase CG5065 [Leptinotarsa decemlineata]